MNDIKLINKLSGYSKSIFSVADLQKILSVNDSSVNTVVMRLKKRGVLQSVSHGWYSVYNNLVTPELAAIQIYPPCYLSLKTVLAKAGVINQISRQIDCVTLRKTYKTQILNINVIYHQIKPELFFGFYLEDNLLLAYPEKALLDLYYFNAKGKETINAKEFDLSRLNKSRLKQFQHHFPKNIVSSIASIAV